MIKNNDFRVIEKVLQKINPDLRLMSTKLLEGGITAQTEFIEAKNFENNTFKFVLRIFKDKNFSKYQKKVIKEFKLLSMLSQFSVPIQKPIITDISNDLLPYPYIVLEYVEGEVLSNFNYNNNMIRIIAEHLVIIHKIDLNQADYSFLEVKFNSIKSITDKNSYGIIQDQGNKLVLLHGDFWPGNIIWKEGKINCIIDWEEACLGDPLFDVANTRLEILWAFGEQAMEDFSNIYKSLMPIVDFTSLPYWDLFVAQRVEIEFLDWFMDPIEKSLKEKRFNLFINQAKTKINIV